jgi:histone-binding protein RBBP4
MIWQPTMRVWAGDEVKIDEKELEGEPMEGIEGNDSRADKTTASGSGGGSRSQSMSVSATSNSGGVDEDV